MKIKSQATFLLTLFAVFLLLPSEIFACACCANRGDYSLSFAKPNQYMSDVLKEIRFSSAEIFAPNATAEEDFKGIKPIRENYKIKGSLKAGSWQMMFTDDKNNKGTLDLPMPEKMIQFMVDTYNSPDSSVELYKELRFKNKVRSGTGIFNNKNIKGAEYFLVLQGRGNACTNTEDFKHWRLEVKGKNINYTFVGQLTDSSNETSGITIDKIAKEFYTAFENRKLNKLDKMNSSFGSIKVIIENSLGEAEIERTEVKTFAAADKWIDKRGPVKNYPRTAGPPIVCKDGTCKFDSKCCLHNQLFLDRFEYAFNDGKPYIKTIYMIDGN